MSINNRNKIFNSLKISISSFKIKTKEKNCTIVNIKVIILFLQIFYIYM